MKVFVSYRRDDTGGRAGRLFDVFAAKYGQQRVFQDVSSASPGLDFTQRIESTIADSDVVLVVIGPTWLTSATPDGLRRIDQPDDFVRREVGAALATDTRVVPVLVDGAELPRPEDLPDELRGLVHRQAVTMHDTSWHHDVDVLIRQLEGQSLPLVGRRRTTLVVVGAVLVLLVVGVGIAVVLSNDDPAASGANGDTGQLTGCPDVDDPSAALTPLELAADPPATFDWGDGHLVEVEIVGGWTRPGTDGTDVLVAMKVSNVGESIEGTFTDDEYLNEAVIGGLLVDGVDQGTPWCITVDGDPEIEPTESAIAIAGWEGLGDPAGLPITLEAFAAQDFAVTRP